MYVCLCNGYRDTALRELAEKGMSCAVEIYHTLGNGPCCGRCLDCAQQIVNETHMVARAGGEVAAKVGEPTSA